MSTPPPAEAFAESVRLLLTLHGLYARGLSESPDADAIRDAMDAPWYAMTDEEQGRVGQLSADLYTIGERHSDPPPPPDVGIAFERARTQPDWMAVLSLLQDHPGLAEPHQRSHLRSTAWAALGAPLAAVLFLADALRADAARAHVVSSPSPIRPASAAGSRQFPRYGRIEREAA